MKQYQVVESSTSSRFVTLDLDSKLLQEGIIEINDAFAPDTVSDWRNALLYLKSRMTPEETVNHPIQLHINSPGGEIYSMFGLYDTIKQMQAQGYVIATINVGVAASAACLILMAGNKGQRKSLTHCHTMIHTVSSGTYGKIADMIVDVNESQKIQEELNNIIKDCADPQLIEECKYLDFWMNSEETLKYGIIDKII